MSVPVTKQRSMIDLDEFERRLRRPGSGNHWDSEPIADLAQLLGRRENLTEVGFESKGRGSIDCRLSGERPGERKDPPPLERFITGDFAAIEAGLLGIGPKSEARVAEAQFGRVAEAPVERKASPVRENFARNGFAVIESELAGARRREPAFLAQVEEIGVPRKEPSAPSGSSSRDFAAIEAELFSIRRPKAEAAPTQAEPPNVSVDGSQDADDEADAIVSRRIEIGDEEIRSRLPLYAMAAIVVAGLAGIGASFVSRSGESSPPEIATRDAVNETFGGQAGSASGPDASSFSTSQQASTAVSDNSGQSSESGLAQEKAPRVISLGESAQSDNEVAAEAASVPTPQEQTRAEAEQPTSAAPSEPPPVRTVAVRPDGALVPNEATPQAAAAAPPAPRPVAAAKTQTPTPPHRTATAAKPAGGATSGGRPAQSANAAKAKPAAKTAKVAPATGADVPAAAPPAAAGGGAFGFVQTTVSSITTGAAKLFDWGRPEPGAHP